jgi:methylthioribose-1-phosphate isomerase
VRLIDQRRLPEELVFIDARTVAEVCDAITSLAVRGAPALAVAGAMGVALASTRGEDLANAAHQLIATRPTAVNLQWGVRRAEHSPDPVAEAQAMVAEDIERNRRLAALGAELLPEGARVLTHCNTGSLACAGYGTALGVVRAAHEAGRHPRVWVDETRPVLQGARLTAWELERLGIPHTLIVDGAAASLMAQSQVDAVVVGADRIAANGDVANKVGTYSLAVLAYHHSVPFYVAAPVSTVDLQTPDGSAIPVEQRPASEVYTAGDRRIAPRATPVSNPAFDVTPERLVTAIVTDAGVARPPYDHVLKALVAATATK